METCWNVTIKDTSSIIKYLPYADGDTQGWTGVFSGDNQVVNGVAVGTGDSQHVTAGNQAFAEIVFNGTAVYLNGATTGNMQYEVELDGQVTAGQPNAGLLASFTGLSGQREHTLLLRSKPQASGDFLALQSAIITVGTGLTGASFAQSIKEEDDAAWSYGPGYTEATNPVTNANMRQTLTPGSWAALTFSGHSVLVHGPKNVDHGQYSVTLAGRTQTYNGTSTQMVKDAVLFFAAGMNSLDTHVVNITNLDGRVMDISYAEIITVQGGTAYDPQSANTGSAVAPGTPAMAAILGGAVGGVVLLLLGVIFWFWWRRKKKQPSTEDGSTETPSEPSTVDDSNPEMTMAALAPVMTKSSTGPRVRFGELARPGMEGAPTTERSETPPALRPTPSILRRQDSNTSSVAPLLAPGRMNQSEDQISLASTYSGPDVSASSLTVAPPDSRPSSSVSSDSARTVPARPPRPPQDLFATSEVPKFPEPELSATQPRASNEDPFSSTTRENPQTNTASHFSGGSAVVPDPPEGMESIGRLNTASPAPDNPKDLQLQTEDIPQPASQPRSATQARKDLLVALETDQVATISRSGTRKVGLPSNPRAGLSRQ